MMHPCDVEQELLDPPGLGIVMVLLHLDAPLPPRILLPIGWKRKYLAGKIHGRSPHGDGKKVAGGG
jgi:hypothetical protein